MHWLRRLVFRSAWLDQRVKEGELDVAFDEITHTFGYVQPERDDEPIELSPEPNWGRVAYTPAASRRLLRRRPPTRALAIASAPASPTSAPRAACRCPAGRAPGSAAAR